MHTQYAALCYVHAIPIASFVAWKPRVRDNTRQQNIKYLSKSYDMAATQCSCFSSLVIQTSSYALNNSESRRDKSGRGLLVYGQKCSWRRLLLRPIQSSADNNKYRPTFFSLVSSVAADFSMSRTMAFSVTERKTNHKLIKVHSGIGPSARPGLSRLCCRQSTEENSHTISKYVLTRLLHHESDCVLAELFPWIRFPATCCNHLCHVRSHTFFFSRVV